MDRRTLLASVGGGAAAALAGCLADSPDLGPNEVGMSTRRFEPAEKTVSVGTTVRWRNTARGVHTVTAYENAIPDGAAYFATGGYDDEAAAREAWQAERGGGLDPEDSFSVTFDVPGEYEYFCIPHEVAGMKGTVVVEG